MTMNDKLQVGRSKYPWDVWLDGTPRKLTRGIHFDVSLSSFRQIVYTTAERKGIKVSVSAILGESFESLVIQALKGTELTISERRASLESRFDERELIEKCEDDLQLTENVLNRLNTKNEMELVRGRDYDISDIKLVRAIYNAAARQGVNTSRWKYERTKCGLRFYVEEVDDKIDKWVGELADIPQGEINKEIFEYKIYFKDPTGYTREQKAKFCSFCGRPIKKKDLAISGNSLEHIYKKVKLADLTIEEGRPVSATEKLVLKRIKDFVGTPISCAEKIRNVAIDKGINIDDWEFIFDNKNELVILCGNLAEQHRSYQLERRYIKLMIKKMNDPPSQVKIEEWVDELAKENWLQIVRGRDYFCPERVVTKWCLEIAKQKGIIVGGVIPESKIGDSDYYGITFTTRKFLPTRFKALDLEKPVDAMERMEELGYGYVIDQPFVGQRLEFEEQRQIKDTKYAKKLLGEELKQYKKDIAKVKVEGVRQILQEKINQVEYKLEEVKQIELEQRKLKELENKNVE